MSSVSPASRSFVIAFRVLDADTVGPAFDVGGGGGTAICDGRRGEQGPRKAGAFSGGVAPGFFLPKRFISGGGTVVKCARGAAS